MIEGMEWNDGWEWGEKKKKNRKKKREIVALAFRLFRLSGLASSFFFFFFFFKSTSLSYANKTLFPLIYY